MGWMIRKQVYIKREQEQLLKQHSRELDLSEFEIIRQGIDSIGRFSTTLPFHRMAWQKELAFIRQRAQGKALERKRGWTREELYEE